MKNTFRLVIAVIALAASFATIAEETTKANLLKNETLSDGGGKYTPGWTFSFWMIKKGSPEEAIAKYGIEKEEGSEKNKCLYLGTKKAGKIHMWYQQQLECEPGQTYKLSFRIKGNKSECKWGGPGCGIYFMDENGKWLSYHQAKDLKLTPEWSDGSVTVTAPDNALKIGVRMGLGGIGLFNIYYDDIKLIDVNQ